MFIKTLECKLHEYVWYPWIVYLSLFNPLIITRCYHFPFVSFHSDWPLNCLVKEESYCFRCYCILCATYTISVALCVLCMLCNLFSYNIYLLLYILNRKRRGQGGMCPPRFGWGGGGNCMFVPPLLTSQFYFPLELYVYTILTINYLASFIYQLIILCKISIKWYRWLLRK